MCAYIQDDMIKIVLKITQSQDTAYILLTFQIELFQAGQNYLRISAKGILKL